MFESIQQGLSNGVAYIKRNSSQAYKAIQETTLPVKIISSVGALTATGVAIYYLTKKNNEAEKESEIRLIEENQSSSMLDSYESSSMLDGIDNESTATVQPSESETSVSRSAVRPNQQRKSKTPFKGQGYIAPRNKNTMKRRTAPERLQITNDSSTNGKKPSLVDALAQAAKKQ